MAAPINVPLVDEDVLMSMEYSKSFFPLFIPLTPKPDIMLLLLGKIFFWHLILFYIISSFHSYLISSSIVFVTSLLKIFC
uniref:Uncharacterized protein n=1 Tax=Rhizophora mucronata TaxID=61149 RepID=A0A2P2LNT8_RHIMU